MSSVGETLRRERLRTGLDLEKLSQNTKISVRMLELIESDRFDKLPGGVFARSFVRQYARAVGLDEDEMAGELERMLEPAPEPRQAAQDTAKPEIRLPRVTRWGGAGSRLRQSSSLPALALVVLVMLACSAAYTWWQKSRHNPGTLPATTTPATVVSAPPMQAPPPAPEPRPTVTEPVTATASRDNSAGALHVALTAEEATWVRATANGKVVFSGVIQPNETKSLDTADVVTLRIGNAGGIAISLNGKSIPAVGPKGQVRIVQLSPDGAVQVIPPAKPPEQSTQTQTL